MEGRVGFTTLMHNVWPKGHRDVLRAAIPVEQELEIALIRPI